VKERKRRGGETSRRRQGRERGALKRESQGNGITELWKGDYRAVKQKGNFFWPRKRSSYNWRGKVNYDSVGGEMSGEGDVGRGAAAVMSKISDSRLLYSAGPQN